MDGSYEPTTIAGVIVLTTFVVSQLKMALGNTPYIRRVPMFAVSIFVALVLCLLSKWAGYLEGDIFKLLSQTLIAAFGAGGLYNVYSGSATQSMQDAANRPSSPGVYDMPTGIHYTFLLIGLSVMLSGCGNFMKSYQDSTPLGKVALAKKDFTVLLNTISDLRDQGFLTQAQIDKTKDSALAAKLALDEWEYDVSHNMSTKDVESRFESAASIIRRLRDALRPTTQPSSFRSTTNVIGRIAYFDRWRSGSRCYASARGT